MSGEAFHGLAEQDGVYFYFITSCNSLPTPQLETTTQGILLSGLGGGVKFQALMPCFTY